MRVIDIIEEAAKMLRINEILNDIDNKIYDGEEINNMLMAVNLVNNNIASNYIEIIKSKSVKAINDVIPFNDICEDGIINIKSLIEKNSREKRPYTIMADGVHIQSGFYEIEFSSFPRVLEVASDIDCYTKINCRLFAIGVVAEYLFLKGDIEEAYVWDKRFKQTLSGVVRTNRKLFTMPRRRWE